MPTARRVASLSRPFKPTDLGIALCAWYDADDRNTIILNGTNVSQWSDKSGLSFHVIQATAGAQPGYVARTSATPPYIDFTVQPPSSLVSSASFNKMTSSSSRTFFGVYTPKGTASAAAYLSWGFNSASNLNSLQNFGGNDPYYGGFSQDVSSGIAYAADIRMLASLSYSGSVSAVGKNGATPVTATRTLSTTTSQPIRVCQSQGGSGQQHYAHEYIVFSSLLDPAQTAMVEGYLAWKWGLATALSANHQYKFQPPRIA